MVLPDHLKALLQDEEEQATPSKEQQIAWLYQIINTELQKNEEEVDYDLVMECTDFLSELTSADTLYSIEEIEQKLNQLKSNLVQAKEDTQKTRVPTIKRKCKPWLKVVAALAATFTVFFTTISIVAKTQGYGSAWEYVVTNARQIMGLDPGEQINENGITITKPTETATYATIEELVEKENLNILYPTKLPDGVKLESIIQTYQSEDKYSLFFDFSDETFMIRITNQLTDNNDNSDHKTLYRLNNINFYVTELGSNMYHATCQYKGLKYAIQCNDHEVLISLLTNMKGN